MVRAPLDAVRVLGPLVFRITENVPTPFTRVDDAGRVAWPSFEVIETVPEKSVAVLPPESLAVTVTLKELPARVVAGTELKTSWVAPDGLTVMAFEVALRVPSPTVSVLDPEVFSVMVKLPTPLMRELAAGKVARASVEVKFTVLV